MVAVSPFADAASELLAPVPGGLSGLPRVIHVGASPTPGPAWPAPGDAALSLDIARGHTVP